MPTLFANRSVLIVDDASLVAETLALILSSRGHQAKVAHSAEEAIDIFSGWKPDIAILDVVLPGMNGIELGKVLKANYPDCEIVFISGAPQVGELLELARAQGESYSIQAKPLDPASILAIVTGTQPASKDVTDA